MKRGPRTQFAAPGAPGPASRGAPLPVSQDGRRLGSGERRQQQQLPQMPSQHEEHRNARFPLRRVRRRSGSRAALPRRPRTRAERPPPRGAPRAGLGPGPRWEASAPGRAVSFFHHPQHFGHFQSLHMLVLKKFWPLPLSRESDFRCCCLFIYL